MTVQSRRQAILELLHENGELAVADLSLRFDVSENTIRNDLNAMEAENLLQRVRGGALALQSDRIFTSKAFASRASVNRQAKELMARWAAQRVDDGDAIVLDASSTAFHLAALLGDRQDLTVVTNGLEAAMFLARNPSNKVILAANVVRPDGFTLVGELHPSLAGHFSAAKCFITCTGLSVDQGLTEADVDEAPLKSAMMRLARQVIALVDHSKVGKVDTYRFAGLEEITHLITDEGIARHDLARLHRAATGKITIVGESRVETLLPVDGSARERTYRIGFGNMTEKMVFAQQVRRSLQRASEAHDSVELIIRDNNLDPQTALENADWFVAHGVDLVIEYQVDARAGNTIMDRFNQAGIPVIAVDIPMPGATFFGADNYRAGYIAGEALGHWINKQWQGQLDLLLKLELPRVGTVAGARIQGQHEGLETVIGPIPEDKILSVDSPFLVNEAISAIASLLQSITDDARVAIIAINDDAALGALTAFQDAGRLDQVVAVGQNADRLGREALRRDDLPFIGSTRYAPEHYGEQLLDLALRILRGQPSPPAVYNQHVFITRDNIDEYYPELAETGHTRRSMDTDVKEVSH